MFTAEEKQKVREATDLVALVSETVPLRQRGRDLWGCCPFHHEKSPSFHVIPERGFWKCFSALPLILRRFTVARFETVLF